jgi:NADPH:quinone reductase-like Zn-dependent oxidoreductase
VDAAAFIMIYATSHHALVDRGQLKAGETVLVLGAAGGVGTAAIQIAKAMGAKVIAAASTDEKCALCKTSGGRRHHQLQQGEPARRAQGLTDGKGPDVIYDPVGGDFAEPAFRSIAWRGRYLVVGFAAGPIPALPLNLALLKGASIVGVFWGDFAKPRAQGQRRHDGRAGPVVRPGQDQARDRPHHAHERAARRLRPHGLGTAEDRARPAPAVACHRAAAADALPPAAAATQPERGTGLSRASNAAAAGKARWRSRSRSTTNA